MIRDLKADCAKRTEEVCSGFCNIGSGISLKRQKWHPKSKELIFWCFFYVQAGGRREDKNNLWLIINEQECGKQNENWKNKENDVERERSVYVPFFVPFGKMIKEGQWRKEWKRAYPWICRLLRICSGEAIEGTIPATQEYRDFVKNLHSKQILNMQVIIPVLWSPVPVWNNPKEPSDWEKVIFLRAMASMKILIWRLGWSWRIQ